MAPNVHRMTLREQVPKPLRLPVGFASLAVMIIGVAVGYILMMLGLTLYFNLNGLEEGAITQMESIQVMATGVGATVLGYLGWRGFNYFSY